MILSAATEGEDAVILDLEDACPLAEKETGRIFARDAIGTLKRHGLDVFVRVNSFDTGFTEQDLDYVVVEGLDGILLPKAESAEDIVRLDTLLTNYEARRGLSAQSLAIIALVESPRGIEAAPAIISASKRVIALAFGAGDYSRELGIGMGVTSLSPDDRFLMASHPRACIALAARAANVLALDTPFFGLVIDLDGLVHEARQARLVGFTGKLLVYPRHIAPVNQVFSPAAEELDLARKVIAAYEEARAKGLGATSLGGKMIDYGSYRRAASLVAMDERLAAKEKQRVLAQASPA